MRDAISYQRFMENLAADHRLRSLMKAGVLPANFAAAQPEEIILELAMRLADAHTPKAGQRQESAKEQSVPGPLTLLRGDRFFQSRDRHN